MIPGRSKAAFKAWLTQRPQAWREAVKVVAMDGFTGLCHRSQWTFSRTRSDRQRRTR
jgi:transposase